MSIIVLLVGGFIVKIMSFIIKILFTREIGEEGLSLYTIAIPTYSLLVALAIFALPTSISKLVSEQRYSGKQILITSFFLILILQGILVTSFYQLSPLIAEHLLKQKKLTIILKAMILTLPFISLSSIFKGYFLGKMKVMPNTLSNIIEQTIRIIFLLYFLPPLVQKDKMLGLISFILLSILTEIISCLVFCIFLPKKISFQNLDFHPKKKIIKELLDISIPCVSSRFIGNIGFFLEPIIITNLLLKSGYSSSYILKEYASYNAYALGLLTMPSFFITAIDQILIPEISKHFAKKNLSIVKKRLKQALFYSLIIGVSSSLTILFFKKHLLHILYNTTSGGNYINFLAPFFVLFYLEAPLISTMQAIGLAKTSFKISFLAMILKLLVLSLLCTCHIGLYALVIAEIINIIFVVYHNYQNLEKHLNLKTLDKE